MIGLSVACVSQEPFIQSASHLTCIFKGSRKCSVEFSAFWTHDTFNINKLPSCAVVGVRQTALTGNLWTELEHVFLYICNSLL